MRAYIVSSNLCKKLLRQPIPGWGAPPELSPAPGSTYSSTLEASGGAPVSVSTFKSSMNDPSLSKRLLDGILLNNYCLHFASLVSIFFDLEASWSLGRLPVLVLSEVGNKLNTNLDSCLRHYQHFRKQSGITLLQA